MPNQSIDLLRQSRGDMRGDDPIFRYIQQMQNPQQQAMGQMGADSLPQLSPDQKMNQAAIQSLMNYDYVKAGEFWKQALMINPNNQDALEGLQRVRQILSRNTRLGRSTTEGFR